MTDTTRTVKLIMDAARAAARDAAWDARDAAREWRRVECKAD